MHPPHTTSFVAMGKRPLDQFAALLQQLLAIVAFDPPPIRVHRFLLICLPLPIALRSFRFRYIGACLGLLNRQYSLIAVVSLVATTSESAFRLTCGSCSGAFSASRSISSARFSAVSASVS